MAEIEKKPAKKTKTELYDEGVAEAARKAEAADMEEAGRPEMVIQIILGNGPKDEPRPVKKDDMPMAEHDCPHCGKSF